MYFLLDSCYVDSKIASLNKISLSICDQSITFDLTCKLDNNTITMVNGLPQLSFFSHSVCKLIRQGQLASSFYFRLLLSYFLN